MIWKDTPVSSPTLQTHYKPKESKTGVCKSLLRPHTSMMYDPVPLCMYAEPFYNHNLTSSAQTKHIIRYVGGAECDTDAAFQKT